MMRRGRATPSSISPAAASPRSRWAWSRSPAPPAPTWSWAAATTCTTTRIPANATARASRTSPRRWSSRCRTAPGAPTCAPASSARSAARPRGPRQEQRVMLGAVLAQRQTGAAINVHPGRHPDQPQEVADFIRRQGRPDGPRDHQPHRPHRLRRGAAAAARRHGRACSSWTSSARSRPTTGWPTSTCPTTPSRLRAIRGLIDRGHLAQVLISPRHLLPLAPRPLRRPRLRPHLRQRRADDAPARLLGAEIDAILVDNPRRLLTIA